MFFSMRPTFLALQTADVTPAMPADTRAYTPLTRPAAGDEPGRFARMPPTRLAAARPHSSTEALLAGVDEPDETEEGSKRARSGKDEEDPDDNDGYHYWAFASKASHVVDGPWPPGERPPTQPLTGSLTRQDGRASSGLK